MSGNEGPRALGGVAPGPYLDFLSDGNRVHAGRFPFREGEVPADSPWAGESIHTFMTTHKGGREIGVALALEEVDEETAALRAIQIQDSVPKTEVLDSVELAKRHMGVHELILATEAYIKPEIASYLGFSSVGREVTTEDRVAA